MLEQILPPAVAVAESTDDSLGQPLYPEEEELSARAVDKRRQEFTTARTRARTALGRLGVPAGPIGRGERGAPQWPPGLVGSITHTQGFRGCAVARAADVASVGVDAEPNGRIPDDVLGLVADDTERAWITDLLVRRPDVSWDRLLFSAKESVYKTWFPLTGRWLDFSEATISVDPAAGTFTARLLVPGPVVNGRERAEFAGRWLIAGGLVLTAIALRD